MTAIVVAGQVLDPVAPAPGTPTALAISGGRIAGVMTVDEGMAVADRHAASVIDLSSCTVTPGFFDAHNHQPSAARDALEVPTAHVTSIAELRGALAEWCAGRTPGTWVVTERSLSRAQLAERRFPTARELDDASRRHPIVVRFGAHAAVLNSAALVRSGLAELVTDPVGGRLERDEDGRPSGPVHEYGALAHIDAQRPPPSEAELVDALAAVQRSYVASGITSVRIPGVRPGELAWYQRLRDRGEPLHNRVSAAVRVDPTLSAADKRDLVASWQVRTGFGNDRLRIDGLKLFVDGGVDADADHPSTLFLSPPELNDLVGFATARGWSVACHANTSVAVDMVLDAYAAARSAARVEGPLVIEHGLFMTTAQLRRAAGLGVWLSTQPGLLDINDHLLDGSASEACPLASALGAGVRVALGSDWNATPGTRRRPYSPLRTMAAARRDRAEAIDPWAALRLHTRAPAALIGHPSLGSLAVGAPADLVAFDGLPGVEELTGDADAVPCDVVVGGRQVLAAGQPCREGARSEDDG